MKILKPKDLSAHTLQWASLVGAGAFALGALLGVQAAAQSCTMQAQLAPDVYAAAKDAALTAASSIQSGDGAKVRANAAAEYAANFAAADSIISSLAPKLAGDTLAVTQVFQLDATNRHAGDASLAEFTCTPPASATEVDFSISGLPPGTYIFAMVEASGPKPWLLSMLLHREAGAWKLAGFYPHPRTAGGTPAAPHDGLFYWRAARVDAKAAKPWLAWLEFSLADALLRPANFIVSTHLDALRAEQRTAAPPGLSDGVSAQSPLLLKGAAGGADVRVIDLSAEPSSDGSQANLVMHVSAAPLPDATAERERNLAAARALLDAHPELRTGFGGVLVVTEVAGQNPFVTEHAIADIPQP